MRLYKCLPLIAAALATVSVSASETLTVHSLTAGKFAAVNLNYNGNTLNVYAGPQSVSLNGGSLFDAYCVDLDHWNSLPSSYPVNVLSTDLLTNGQRIAYLYNTYAPTVTNSTMGAALQLAIWDVLVDGGNGFSAGNLKSSVSGNTLTQANAFLAASAGQSSEASWLKATHHGASGNKYQNLVGPAVPGPAAALPFLTSLAVLRRRRQKAQA